jgi:hypothetical protein
MALESVLDHSVEGVNLSHRTLRGELGDAPTLVVFLRHLGCIFCREMVKDLRKVIEADKGYPPVLFFYQGSVDEGRAFFEQRFPQARAVADLPRAFYTAAGLQQANTAQLFSPRLMMCTLRATAKGNTQRLGRVIGDPWMMPGVMLLQQGKLLWQHEFLHAGDHPDFRRVPGILKNILAIKATTVTVAPVVESIHPNSVRTA